MRDRTDDNGNNGKPRHGKTAPASAPRPPRAPQEGVKGQVIDLAEYRRRKGR